jgi:glycosyltransferase involved in cell wall biosynthesis
MRSKAHFFYRHLQTTFYGLLSPFTSADLALFHEFAPAPGGGGHQFLRALVKALLALGLRVENNRLSHTTRAGLFNSFNFDFDRLRRLQRPGVRLVHRVDGPIGVYRGREDGADRRIWEINQELARATIFQSAYSLRRHTELGMEFRDPVVIHNTPDPDIFFPAADRAPLAGRKIRLISTSWSDNPNKGAAAYAWLDSNLDFSSYEYTFVGRLPLPVNNIRLIQPLPSQAVANLLRAHDVYITASRFESCSNALLEGLACGLPALYLDSGGHPELVKGAGLPFETPEEIPPLLQALVDDYPAFQARIRLPTLAETARRYLEVLLPGWGGGGV